MSTVNTYGLKLHGLKSVSETTFKLSSHPALYCEIFYDKDEDKVWAVDQFDLGHNSFSLYKSKSIIKICDASGYLSQQKISDLVHETLKRASFD